MNFNPDNITSIHMFQTPIRQTWGDLFFMNELLTNLKFDHLVELGTYQGGLAVFLGLHAYSRGIDVVTFDIRQEPQNTGWRKFKPLLPITFYQLDVFSEKALSIVREKARSGRMFIVLDGGDKPKDFETYAPLLTGNDVVLIHDKGKYIHDYEATPIAERNGLVPFYQEEADKLNSRCFSYIKKYK